MRGAVVNDAMPIFSAIPADVRRAACAFHEAGHIVVGWHYRRRISHAWLRPPHGASGETCFEPYERGFRGDDPADRRRAEIEITILHAGHCGEMIYWDAEGLPWHPGTIRSHEDDLRQIEAFVDILRPVDAAALQARCASAATVVLYRPAMLRAHAAIARRLFEQRRIHRDEVEDIIGRESRG